MIQKASQRRGLETRGERRGRRRRRRREEEEEEEPGG